MSAPTQDSTARVVLCACPDAAVAQAIARIVVEKSLAACVNLVGPIRSFYRWKGVVHDDAEVMLIIKTSASRIEALRQHIVALHPYECPEVVVLPIVGGHRPYLDWLLSETCGSD